MVEETRHNQTAMSAGVRCVVLVGGGGAPPVGLLEGLSSRGVNTAVVSDPAQAMLSLAKHQTGALVVVEPDQQPWLGELVEALKSYYPRTVRWAYRANAHSGTPKLEPLLGKPSNGAGEKPLTLHAEQPESKSNHRYMVPDPKSPLGRAQSQIPRERVRSLVVKVQGSSEVDEPLISEEELSMLLGPAPEETGGLT